jgi:hypothetical protein
MRAPTPSEASEPDGLNDVAALLAEQLSACHAAATRCFAIANDEEDFEIPVRLDALKLATRLVQASAAAASAVKRVKGGEFHHHVTVQRIDYGAEKAARKARELAKQPSHDELFERVRAKIEKAVRHYQKHGVPGERRAESPVPTAEPSRSSPDLRGQDGEAA